MGFAVCSDESRETTTSLISIFVLSKRKGYIQRNRKKILYPNQPSSIRPVPRFADLPVPITSPCLPELKGESSKNSENSSCDSVDTFQLSQEATKPNLISQDLKDLVRDFNLTDVIANSWLHAYNNGICLLQTQRHFLSLKKPRPNFPFLY